MSERLQGRTALVTGSTDGIGAAVAAELAAEGATVVVTGRNTERGEKTVAAITAEGGRAVFVRADLGEGTEAVRALADAAHEVADGPLDILVNNAAMILTPSPTGEVTQDTIDRALAINVRAPYLLTGMVAPRMAERAHGAIVNIGSMNGILGMGGSALYSTTKAAVHSLTKSWAAEYGPAGVRVNTVAPGPTETPGNSELAEILAPMLERAPSRRMSTLKEVARAVVFLAGDDAGNVHGATLSVDGGFTVV